MSTSSEITIYLFTVSSYQNSLDDFKYQDIIYEYNVSYENTQTSFTFLSFSIFCLLMNDEQLDLSMSDQDESQSQSWSCDHYLESYYSETEDCQNITNSDTCFWLWHY